MDFLSKISTGTKVIILVGVLLTGALAVVAVQWQPEGHVARSESPKPLKPTEPTPSKENVSTQVQARIDHLKDVAAKKPNDAIAAFELAKTLQDGHDIQGALKYYELGLKADPRNLQARVDYSLCLYQSGKEEEAFVQNRVVLKQDASNIHALYNLGAIYANRGMTDSAMYFWKRLISSHPHDDLAQKAEQNLKQLVSVKSVL